MGGGAKESLKGIERVLVCCSQRGEEERERGRGTTHFPQPGKEGAAANDGKWDYGRGEKENHN